MNNLLFFEAVMCLINSFVLQIYVLISINRDLVKHTSAKSNAKRQQRFGD